jgi:hypothetical protein
VLNHCKKKDLNMVSVLYVYGKCGSTGSVKIGYGFVSDVSTVCVCSCVACEIA